MTSSVMQLAVTVNNYNYNNYSINNNSIHISVSAQDVLNISKKVAKIWYQIHYILL